MANRKKADAKKNGKAKEPKPRKERANKGGRRPEGGLGLRDDERQALHFRHVTEYERALVVKNEGAKILKDAKERIKDEGGSIKAIELTIALRTEEGQTAFQTRMAEQVEIAKWNGVGVQLSMFDEKVKLDAIYEDGKRAAMQDEAARPPSHLAQKAAQRWLSGHADGRVALNATRAEGFKPLKEAAEGPLLASTAKVPPATDAYPPGPIGTEQPTHAIAS